MTSPSTTKDLKQQVKQWYDCLNAPGSRCQSWLNATQLPPLPPFCPTLPDAYDEVYMRPRSLGAPYLELPADKQAVLDSDGTRPGGCWLVAHFGPSASQQVQLFLTTRDLPNPQHPNQLSVCRLGDHEVLVVEQIEWQTPVMKKTSTDSEEDLVDWDDQDPRLVWNRYEADGDGAAMGRPVSFKANQVMLWLLEPCSLYHIRQEFPHIKELPADQMLYHGSYTGPDKFMVTNDFKENGMWFTHIPCPELDRASSNGGDWRTKGGITWDRPHVYRFRVNRRLDLLDLTRLNRNAIYLPRSLQCAIAMAAPEVRIQARLTGTTPEARIMGRSLINQLMLARAFVADPMAKRLLPRWLPVQHGRAGVGGDYEDWDSEALGGMAADSGMVDGWYGCDYSQTSLQREVVLWSDDYGDHLEFCGLDKPESEEEEPEEQPATKGTKRSLVATSDKTKITKKRGRGRPRKKLKQK